MVMREGVDEEFYIFDGVEEASTMRHVAYAESRGKVVDIHYHKKDSPFVASCTQRCQRPHVPDSDD
jgi:hypothetical protein